MKLAILGFARDGHAAYDYFSKEGGHTITICDGNKDVSLPAGVGSQLGENWLRGLDQFDLLVRTAGLHPEMIRKANPDAPDILGKVTGNIDLFFEASPSRNIIGITGTKGKGTTSTLIAKMLEAGGKRVHLGGNIGIPALELLKSDIHADDWVVLEQSSFQLIDQKHSPHIAVCLMVEPEHLNWHTDMDEYIDAKSQLFIHQTTNDIAIYFAQNETSEDIASTSDGTLIPYFSPEGAYVRDDVVCIDDVKICDVKELKLLGKHNWQNVCAAVTAVWQITKDTEALRTVLTSFSGLEHRLELVRELNGVKYYDDSFGTTPETAMVALEAFAEPKIAILGGSDKGATFEKLAQTVTKNNVRQVITIGDTGSAIAATLRKVGYEKISEGGNNIGDIVRCAQLAASPGDIVLLSTACASFGLFEDYKDRGEQFKQAVLQLS